MARILLIDDDVDFSPLLAESLSEQGHQVHWLECAEQGLDLLARRSPEFDVVLLDQCLPRMFGLEFLEELRRRGVVLPVLLFTGQGTSDVAIRASKLGAFRYLTKPNDLDPDSLTPLLRLIEVAELARRGPDREARLPAGDILPGRSEAMQSVHRQVGLAAGHGGPVLIVGEVGTGKKRTAQAVHHHGAGNDRPLLRVNCLEFADERRLDDELFGYEPDGGISSCPGVFERADGGAVLLDHFHLLGMSAQARLARLIEDGVVRRGGRGAEPRPVRARVLACSSANLRTALREGRLCWELYSLLEGTTITLPPLRERGDDVLLLAELFLAQTAAALSWPARSLAPQARQRLKSHRWPGNVRELRGVIRRAVLGCRGVEVGPDDLEIEPGDSGQESRPEGERKLPLSRERAYRAFLNAIEREPALGERSDADIFRWLKNGSDGEDDGLPANSATFSRYLREARAHYDASKHTPRAGRPHGGSIVQQTDL